LKSRMTPKGHGGEDVVCTDLSIQTKYCYNPKGDDQDEKRKTRRGTTLRVSNECSAREDKSAIAEVRNKRTA